MKFSQLPIGAWFEWKGRVWCKSGPISATPRDGGGQKMIPRAALTRPVEQGAAPAARAMPGRLPVALLEEALAGYTREVLALIEAKGDPDEVAPRLGEIEARLVAHYTRLATPDGADDG